MHGQTILNLQLMSRLAGHTIFTFIVRALNSPTRKRNILKWVLQCCLSYGLIIFAYTCCGNVETKRVLILKTGFLENDMLAIENVGT